MLRAVIERDENDEEMLAIADEFRFGDSEKDLNEVFGAKGGCVADLNNHNPASCTQQSPLFSLQPTSSTPISPLKPVHRGHQINKSAFIHVRLTWIDVLGLG